MNVYKIWRVSVKVFRFRNGLEVPKFSEKIPNLIKIGEQLILRISILGSVEIVSLGSFKEYVFSFLQSVYVFRFRDQFKVPQKVSNIYAIHLYVYIPCIKL